MTCRIATCLFVALIGSVFLLGERASAAVIEVGDLNIIDDPGNPSDGLRFLDMTFSNGKTLADALASAITSYANVRVATPSEFDDLFTAAGISYNGSETVLDAFTPGPFDTIGGGVGVGVLSSQLGWTTWIQGPLPGDIPLPYTLIWTDPDDSSSVSTTRDRLSIRFSGSVSISQSFLDPDSTGVNGTGWLLVSPVPEPSSALLMCLGTAGWLGCQRRRKPERPTVASQV